MLAFHGALNISRHVYGLFLSLILGKINLGGKKKKKNVLLCFRSGVYFAATGFSSPRCQVFVCLLCPLVSVRFLAGFLARLPLLGGGGGYRRGVAFPFPVPLGTLSRSPATHVQAHVRSDVAAGAGCRRCGLPVAPGGWQGPGGAVQELPRSGDRGHLNLSVTRAAPRRGLAFLPPSPRGLPPQSRTPPLQESPFPGAGRGPCFFNLLTLAAKAERRV